VTGKWDWVGPMATYKQRSIEAEELRQEAGNEQTMQDAKKRRTLETLKAKQH